jgi:hypothetical protein
MRALPLLLFASLAIAKPAALVSDETKGTIVTLRDGKWRALDDVTVKLTCSGDEPSGANQWQVRCDSTLRVERHGKLVAETDTGLLGLDHQYVAGNGGKLEILRETVEGDTSLILLRWSRWEGDLWMRSTTTDQLLIVDGNSLREVYRYDSATAFEPGPDGPDSDRKHTECSVDPAETRTLGVRDLWISCHKPDDETRIVWNGTRFIDAPRPTVEPLLVRVLAGQRISAAELRGLQPDEISLVRNAPYARHGRRFKKPELQSFFYGRRGLVVNPAYSDKLLDAADQANIAAAVSATRK